MVLAGLVLVLFINDVPLRASRDDDTETHPVRDAITGGLEAPGLVRVDTDTVRIQSKTDADAAPKPQQLGAGGESP